MQLQNTELYKVLDVHRYSRLKSGIVINSEYNMQVLCLEFCWHEQIVTYMIKGLLTLLITYLFAIV